MIEKAKLFAKKCHEGQVRKITGEPYYRHTYRVYKCVSEETNNPDLLSAALIYDTIEDCGITVLELEADFNGVVAEIVYELTNVYTKEDFPWLRRAERKRKEIERIADISYSAKLIKLSDRIDNLIDFKLHDPEYKKLWLEGRGNEFYYIRESRELLEVLRGVNPRLEKLYEDLV